MGKKNFAEHWGGGRKPPTPLTLEFFNSFETKFFTEVELCIFYPKTNDLVLLIYANEFNGVILLFSSIKRYRNSKNCKIVIFKLITLKFAMWIDKKWFWPE